ncbi:hypothetical protein ABZW49_10565 [Nonomuraea wenchangensis]
MPETPDVRPGQVWADNDERSAGRTLRVDAIEGDKAVCTVLTNSDDTQKHLDAYERPGRSRYPSGPLLRDTRGKVRRISLSRFRPTSTGYRLIADSPKED